MSEPRFNSVEVSAAEADTYTPPVHGWTCFHCGETFPSGTLDDVHRARDHFGATPNAKPGCLLKIEPGEERALLMRVRRLERANEMLRQEIEDDLSRRFYSRLTSEIRGTAPAFKNCSTLRDIFNLFDSTEGRALAAEERVSAMLHGGDCK